MPSICWQPLLTGVAPLTNIAPGNTTTAPDYNANLLQAELVRVRAERDALLEQLGQIPRLPPSHEYDTRTRLREDKICGNNRNKNAWCAWHDSARLKADKVRAERTLSCKCTFEEALLEEELARNGVGSLKTPKALEALNAGGEKVVRLHPSLRKGLLRLLEERYNYRDGDFDVDPTTGQWVDGQRPEDLMAADVGTETSDQA